MYALIMPLVMLNILFVRKIPILEISSMFFYEVGLRNSLKKIDVLYKISHRISIHISNLKNLLSSCSGNCTIEYLNRDEINFMICHICTE